MSEPIERLISLAHAGAPLRVIAADLGISVHRAWAYRRRYAPGYTARRGRPGIGEDRERRLAEMLSTGATDAAIGLALGIDASTVRLRRKRLLPPAWTRRHRRQVILEALRSGATDEQVAEVVGVTRQAVAWIRKRYTSLRRKRGPRPRPPSTIKQETPCRMIPKTS